MEVAIEMHNTLLKRAASIERWFAMLSHGQTSVRKTTVHSLLAYHVAVRNELKVNF